MPSRPEKAVEMTGRLDDDSLFSTARTETETETETESQKGAFTSSQRRSGSSFDWNMLRQGSASRSFDFKLPNKLSVHPKGFYRRKLGGPICVDKQQSSPVYCVYDMRRMQYRMRPFRQEPEWLPALSLPDVQEDL